MNIGFVSTRFSGTDGVTLEAAKWSEVLTAMGHSCFWFSGLSDRPEALSMVVPEAFFQHPRAEAINRDLWNRSELSPEVVSAIKSLRAELRGALEAFEREFRLDLVIVENALTIPMQVPLGLAIADWIRESAIPTIAHHHDFHWERDRFGGEGVRPYLEEAFPPDLPNLAHVVINSTAGRQLRDRRGIGSTVIPNVMNFDHVPAGSSGHPLEIRKSLGYEPGDLIFLQPTRIVPRKGIEHAIDLLAARANPRDRLLVSHRAGDEGYEYLAFLESRARTARVAFHCLGERVAADLGFLDSVTLPPLSLWDLYAVADFVTYPSLYEGFGNALLEAFAFRKPLLVNRYSVYREDIEPLGFSVATMDGQITPVVLDEVERLLDDEAFRIRSTDGNFALAREHFGFATLRTKLAQLLSESASSSPDSSALSGSSSRT